MFLNIFNAFLNDLNTNPVIDEWYMSNFVKKHINTLDSYEAFIILKQFIHYMINNYDEQSEYEIIETLRHLKLQSNTNEIFYNDKQKAKILALYQKEYSQIYCLIFFE